MKKIISILSVVILTMITNVNVSVGQNHKFVFNVGGTDSSGAAHQTISQLVSIGDTIEFRNGSDSVTISGYINAVGRESREIPSARGKFREIIAPKTFDRAIKKAKNIDLLFNHERKLGSLKDNLQLEEDVIGLKGIATVNDEEVIRAARAGKLSGWSFGFRSDSSSDSWTKGTDGINVRTVNSMQLFEVSILTNLPAYIATTIQARDSESSIIERRYTDFQIQDPTFDFYDKKLKYLHLKGCL